MDTANAVSAVVPAAQPNNPTPHQPLTLPHMRRVIASSDESNRLLLWPDNWDAKVLEELEKFEGRDFDFKIFANYLAAKYNLAWPWNRMVERIKTVIKDFLGNLSLGPDRQVKITQVLHKQIHPSWKQTVTNEKNQKTRIQPYQRPAHCIVVDAPHLGGPPGINSNGSHLPAKNPSQIDAPQTNGTPISTQESTVPMEIEVIQNNNEAAPEKRAQLPDLFAGLKIIVIGDADSDAPLTCECSKIFARDLARDQMLPTSEWLDQESPWHRVQDVNQVSMPKKSYYDFLYQLVSILEESKPEIDYSEGTLDCIKKTMEDQYDLLNENILSPNIFCRLFKSLIETSCDVIPYSVCPNFPGCPGMARKHQIEKFIIILKEKLVYFIQFSPDADKLCNKQIEKLDEMDDHDGVNMVATFMVFQAIFQIFGVYQ